MCPTECKCRESAPVRENTASSQNRNSKEPSVNSMQAAPGSFPTPELATGDGALGFWKALEKVSPTTRDQRCTVHKSANVLDKLPRSVQPAAKADLREIWTAPDRATAETAIATFAEKYGAKYAKAVLCLNKDRDTLLPSTNFPPSTGTTCAAPTQSRACLRRSGTAPSAPRARYRKTPPD